LKSRRYDKVTRLNEHMDEESLVWLGRADYARSNFDDIYWSIITIFQILTGENWNDVMYNGRAVLIDPSLTPA
jgi:hypothetical protein